MEQTLILIENRQFLRDYYEFSMKHLNSGS